MSQNYQHFLTFCVLSVEIAPEWKKKYVAKKINCFKKNPTLAITYPKSLSDIRNDCNWASLGFKFSIFSEKMGIFGHSTQLCEKYRVFRWDCEKWGLWVRAIIKIGVLTTLDICHLRNVSSPSPLVPPLAILRTPILTSLPSKFSMETKLFSSLPACIESLFTHWLQHVPPCVWIFLIPAVDRKLIWSQCLML